jgi:hypothetical protein
VRAPEELDAFLRDEIAPRLRAVESERRAFQARRDALALPPAVKLAAAAGGAALAAAAHNFWWLALGAGAPFLVDLLRKTRVPDSVTPLARSALLEPLVSFWDPSFRYRHDAWITQPEFEASRLFADQSFNRFGGEDLVTGRCGATDFRFSELTVRNVERKGKRNVDHLVFHGLFFVADFNKSFRGQTLVLPDLAERALGSFGRAFQSLETTISGLQLIELEDPEFERAFKVCATDPVEARYLLSPSLMRRILAFRQSAGGEVRLGFLGGRVSVAISRSGDLFAIDAGRPLGLEDVRRWAAELRFATSIVDELDLNTRIWSKAAPAA